MASEHVTAKRERAQVCKRRSAMAGTQSDRRGRERRENGGGEVGGSAQEWGGVLQVGAHSFQLTAVNVKSSS